MTSAQKSEKRRHYRGKARPGRRVDLTFRVDSGPKTQAVTSNIGVGGAFILTDKVVAIGTELTLDIMLPNQDDPISVSAEVRWAVTDGGESDGMGVKFLNLDVEALLVLSEYFATLTGTES